jgi:poly-gamma-glutamate capsule biosynthesis protein CapA/YwtB (metallophosphatase superfamily)
MPRYSIHTPVLEVPSWSDTFRKFQPRNLGLDRRVLAVLMLSTQVLFGCSPSPGPQLIDSLEGSFPVSDESQTLEPTNTPPMISAPTNSTLPDEIVLGIEPRWIPAAEIALSMLPFEDIPVRVILDPVDPSLELLESGLVDLLLLPDASGIPVTDRAIALAVPWASEWEQVSQHEAEALIEENSPFVALIEWPEMTASLKPLKIDGSHPSQPDYPLRTSWSLHAKPGLEEIAASIAHALSIHLADEVVKVAAVGDIMLARGLGERIRTGEDAYPFSAVGHLFIDADLAIGNLETALGEGGQAEKKGYTFLAPPQAAAALGHAGFDVLSLANNHAMDFGPHTLLQAIELLEEQGVRTVGAGIDATHAYAPLQMDIANLNLAILAFVDVPVEVRGFDTRLWSAQETKTGIAWADAERMRSALAIAQESADFTIVLLHSGYEYISAPSPPQQTAARLAIDAGADLVIGHHSHVLQGVEHYADGVIIYGLGNFAFEDGGVLESGLMNIWINPDGIRSLEFVPLLVGQDGRPIPADPTRAESIRVDFYSLSRTVEP